MSSHKSRLCIFFALCAFILTGCEEKAPPKPPVASVSYMKVSARKVTLTTELSGRTSAYMISEVRPQVNGIIQARLFDEGKDVKQGEVLYQIDPSLYQAAYDSAQATLQKAEANSVAARLLAERYRQVVRVNAVSKQEYDNAVASYGQAEAEVAAAKAALDTARINLEYTKVTAPVSGRIGRSSITPGALVTQNQPNALATVQQLDPMYVDVTQSSSEMLRLKREYGSGKLKSSGEAMQATLVLEDGTPYMRKKYLSDPDSGKVLEDEEGRPRFELERMIGTLKFSEVTVEQSTGAVTIRAVFPNPDGVLLPGMYVRAILEEGVNDKAVLIPQKTVIRNNRGEPVVRVLRKHTELDAPDMFTVEQVILNVDRPIDNQWLVTGGLNEGDLVMLEGSTRIQSGQTVKGVLEDPAAARPSEAPGQPPARSPAPAGAPEKTGGAE